MAIYDDKNEIIIANHANFENLRKAILEFINNENRQNPLGDMSVSNLGSSNIDSSISDLEISNEKITTNPFTNTINKIYNIVKNNYMTFGDYTSSADNIKLLGEKQQNDIIPALADYFTIVNYWNDNPSESNTMCNGACVGFCSGSCSGKENSGTTTCGDNCIKGCSQVCGGTSTGYTGTSGCASYCTGTCENGCRANCSATENNPTQ